MTDVLHHVWAFGGDTGTVGTAITSGETLALDKFGKGVDSTGLGKWRTLPVALPSKLTFATARTIRRFVYLVGGNAGAGANDSVATAYRARVLDPTGIEVSDIEQLAMIPDATLGLGPGLWYSRVAAVLDSTDPQQPGWGGASVRRVARHRTGLGRHAGPGSHRLARPRGRTTQRQVKSYRVYRSPTANLIAGKEKLLATVPGTQSFFNDTGGATTSDVPRQQGDFGSWVAPASLTTKRQGLGLTVVQNPSNPLSGLGFAETWHLYALGGKNQTGTVRKTYELMTIG
ncbi:MAG: hypothetical protein FJ096_11450, partial [Deltaproteobacteria bacterium]|nr:hypothetical protein [Deltaproteobacteria bacterium]